MFVLNTVLTTVMITLLNLVIFGRTGIFTISPKTIGVTDRLGGGGGS